LVVVVLLVYGWEFGDMEFIEWEVGQAVMY
jgi:hypothetical protein